MKLYNSSYNEFFSAFIVTASNNELYNFVLVSSVHSIDGKGAKKLINFL